MPENPLDSGRKIGKNRRLMRPEGLKGHCMKMLRHTVHGLVAACALTAFAVLGWAAKADLIPVRAALDAKDFDRALSLLQPVMSAGEQSGEAYYLLGAIQVGKGNWTEAETALAEAVNKKRYNEPEAYLAYGQSLIGAGKPAEVGPLLEKTLAKTKDPKRAAALKHVLGLAEMANGNYSKAQEWLLGARVDDEENLVYREALGDAYQKGQIYPLAKGEYEAVLASDSTRVDLMFRIAQTAYQQKQLNEARPLLIDVLRRDSTYDEAYFLLANIYMISAQSRSGTDAIDQYKAALSLYRKVRQVDPTANPVLVAKNIATVYYLLNAHDSAIVEIQNAINTGVTDPELYFYLGRSNMLLGNYEQAIDAFTRYRTAREAEDPPYVWTKSDAELFWRMANSMEALRDSTYWPQIADNYKRALELDPEDMRSMNAYPTVLHKLGRYTEAAVEFDKLVQRNTGDARTLFNASLPYLESGDNQKAVELLLRAAEADTSSDLGYRTRAYKLSGPRLIKMGRTTEAQRCYKWLVDREPDVCDHRQWYGFTLFSTKDYAAAVPHLQRAYKCNEQQGGDPCKYNELRWWLGYALYESGDKDGAYNHLEQVVKCSPSHADAKSLMARIDEEIVE